MHPQEIRAVSFSGSFGIGASSHKVIAANIGRAASISSNGFLVF